MIETFKVIFQKGQTKGVYNISLVESPAMESTFIALAAQNKIELKAIDTEKRILLGAVLIPDKPIYRKQDGKEFNIVFPAETIRLSMENFFSQGYQNNSTLEHEERLQLSDVTFVESWIKEDDEKDKSVLHGFNEPVGTWFAAMKVNNEEVWNDFVKTGKVKGFSIDGFFDLQKISLNKQNEDMDLNKIIDAIKEGFASTKVDLGKVKTDEPSGALTFDFEGDTIAKGLQVSMPGPDNTALPVPDGEYTLDDGMILVIVDSLVSEIKTPVTEEEKPAEEQTLSDEQKAAANVIKSTKESKEVFYALAHNTALSIEASEKRMLEHFDKAIADIKTVTLTKNTKENTKSWEEMTALERRRATK